MLIYIFAFFSPTPFFGQKRRIDGSVPKEKTKIKDYFCSELDPFNMT